MRPQHATIKILVFEGIITQAEADQILKEAEEQGCTPMELLEIRGLISPQTRATFEDDSLERSEDDEDTINPSAPKEATNQPKISAEETLNQAPQTDDSSPSLGDAPTISPRHGLKAEPPWRDHPEAPVKNWQRYQLLRPLGSGGMSQVFLAEDHQLKRKVAIKFLHYNHPSQIARFFQEAQAQARVDHEHVCKIFEVGKVEDQPFIAMQYIPGDSLDKVAKTLPLEQKLLLATQIAWGLQAAHSAGLVHRDIKPGNIMVATQNGLLRPFILDFGLARMEEAPSLTADGSLLGTPAYMPPEQARGELQNLDRRSDVYSLGATIYHVLIGKPPFGSANWAELLRRILEDDVHFPKTNKLPRDIRTIVLKCLEKEPDRRYSSARALAEDLQRYLEGEPIQASPPGLTYRLLKKINKHRWISAALVLVILSLAWGAHTQWQATQRENIVRQLASETNAIEAATLRTFMAPPHDIRDDLARLQKRMTAMAAVISAQGSIAQVPGDYALGVGYLSLNDFQKAREHLQAAWNLGNQTPATAYALSLTHASIYRNELAELQHLDDPETREQRRRELADLLGAEARFYAKAAKGYQATIPNYLEALLAYTEASYPEALALLDKEKGEPAWFFEGNRLRGDIYRDWAGTHYDREEFETARAFSIRARDFYTLAADTARSHPGILLAKANTWLQQMTGDRYSSRDIPDWFEQANQTLEQALSLNPSAMDTRLNRARLYFSYATYLKTEERDPTAHLQQALSDLGNIKQSQADLAMIQARIHNKLAEWRVQQFQDPSEHINAALAELKKTPNTGEDHAYYQLQAKLHRLQSIWAKRSGGDPCKPLEEAVQLYTKSIQLRPDLLHGRHNLLNTLLQQTQTAECLGDEGQLGILEKARVVVDKILEQHPGHPLTYRQAGRVYMALAQMGDPQLGVLDKTYCRKAITVLEEALKNTKSNLQIINNLANAYMTLQRYEWEDGSQNQEHFEKAITLYKQCRELSPNSRFFTQNLAWAYYFHYKFSISNDFDSHNSDQKALDLSLQADKHSSKPHQQSLLCQASVWRKRSENAMRNNEEYGQALTKTLELFNQLIEQEDDQTEYYRSLTALRIVETQMALLLKPEHAGGHLKAANMSMERAPIPKATTYIKLTQLRLAFISYLYYDSIGSPRSANFKIEAQNLCIELLEMRPDIAEGKFFEAALESRQSAQEFAKAHPEITRTWGNLITRLPQ